MKKMKKFVAMLLAMVMVLGMSATSFAAGTTPTENDKAEATVSGVEAGATVTAYRVVEPTYNNGFTGYQAVEGTNIKEPTAPTSTEVTTIAADKALLDSLESESMTAGEGGSYTANLGAGYWVVIVTGSQTQKIYNPMLIGVYYSVDGSGSNDSLVGGSVNAGDNWDLESTPAYAKSAEPTIEKTIVDSDGNDHGNDVAIGDNVDFKIETQIPPYSDGYTKVEVKITDELSEGLKLNGTPVVAVGGEEVEAGENTFTKTQGDRGFTIDFDSDYALEHSGATVVVTYRATVENNAGLNFDANTNTATLTYTNNPTVKSDGTTDTNDVDDRTYTYTFAIDSKLYGSSTTEWNKITEELLKTGEKITIETEEGEIIETNALQGAEFTLTNNKTKKVYTAVSDAEGHLAFTGLDAGSYTLKETRAPEGYSLNETEIPVVITAEYNDDGTLKSYTIKVNNEKTSTYTATYKSGEKKSETVVTTITGDSNTHEIKNTKLTALPSTGGIGTTIFTIGGCAIMILAAGLYFSLRRKSIK